MIYPWQQKQWLKILTCYQQEKLPHALLLTGSYGLGKVDFAKTFSEFILCEAKRESVACGFCRGCQLFKVGNHPDFFMLTPQAKSKNIKIYQIQELISTLAQTAQNNHYQVAIIHPAEAMNRAAANAFLKTLEEPSGQVLLILISHQVETLPPTILSRCQRLTFTANLTEPTIQWLQQQIGSDRNEAIQLLMTTYYAPLRALQLKSLNYQKVRNQLLQALINIIAQHENAISIVGDLLKENIPLILQLLMIISMDVLRVKLNAINFIINFDQQIPLLKLSTTLSNNKLLLLLERLQETWRLTQNSSSVNIQLLLEDLFLIL